jgi:soluble lytic murein transglycosylase-like protein
MRYFVIVFFLALLLPVGIHLVSNGIERLRFSGQPPREWLILAERAALRHDLDPKLLVALITAESNWQADAVSPKGAIGLGQLMPATARELGVNPRDPRQNLDGSARYLAAQLRRFGSVELALCAYHAGPGKILELGRCPNFPETRRYIQHVLRIWRAG